MEQLVTFMLMIATFVLLYFMMVRPEKKRRKKYEEMLTTLKVNDEVVTRGGIMGKIVNLQEDFIILESGPDRTRIKIAMNGIATKAVTEK
ncbi:preprotein translocase, YajC subunit [Clostridium cavendishii DSM 21758]|uniref:Preprotein translocase, YajC subunit n=1 Tax=Clostridium cavendishii DSM 21758 TaxID=1121302 RepID=A0A1M6ACD9_9CLOT|nr:preprotein translocase subunit YajC [Clostridium cavendishii]SHI33833.1 preprotein translocase, YajC subunit [Clostridium cavendishii DSM 21758]